MVGEDLCAGIAYELNRRNEGLCIPALSLAKAQGPKISPPQASPDLSRAVRLTRDAVYAWVNVFTGPAVVTVSQSKQRF